MEAHLARGQLLLQQERWSDALEEFRQALTLDTENSSAQCGAALACLGLDRYAEAEGHGRGAVAADPHHAYAFYVLGQVLYQRRRFDEAVTTLDEALQLDPEEAVAHGLKAHILCDQVRWKLALQAAELGLESDPECSLCLTARSRALVGLGSAGAAGDLLRSQLEHKMEDPMVHASLGWVALEAGQRDQALLHFSEALRLDPEQDWAREGMLQALRARYVVYRGILRYYLWMSRLTPRARWGVVLGAYLLLRVTGALSRSQPTWQPYLQPLLVLYGVFVYLTWTGQSLGTLFLRMNKNGIRLLDSDEIREANWVGGLWTFAALAFLAEAFTNLGLWILGAIFLLLVIPISATFACEPGYPRRCMVAISAVLGGTGLGGFAMAFFKVLLGMVLLKLFIPLFLLGSLAANVLVSARPER